MDTDGNLAALRRYEDQQEKQEMAWEYILAKVEPLAVQMANLKAEMLSEAEDQEFDFEEEILELITDKLEM